MSSSRPARGRPAPDSSRPFNASSAAGSRAKSDVSSSKSSAASANRTSTQTNAARPKVPKSTTPQLSQSQPHVVPSTRVRTTATVKGTLPGATSVITSSRPPSAVHTRPRAQEAASVSEQSDALQVAAQSCAWSYMASTLEDRSANAKEAAQVALDIKQTELAAEEADIADSRVRYEAECLLDFYDELGDRQVAEEVATIIRRFQQLEQTVGKTTVAVLRLTSLPLDDTTHISQYNDILNAIDSLGDECHELEVAVHSLSNIISTRHGRLPAVLRNISDILRGHEENVASARQVVQRCKENYRIGIGTLTLR